ncbi:ATP-dependent helicase Nam7p [[Candida] jaroonii]|uniref:ATP-dependent helicase Nam7p n=1 Tax=[Candida] jaroonii TaxID=467808 RepID=A0ACA9Y336_9ASCO|nr:ATP-dependent helicase Nam7p [[Candida] jaroonii]
MSELLFKNYESDSQLGNSTISVDRTDDNASIISDATDRGTNDFGNDVNEEYANEISCQYCGIDSTDCLIKCLGCDKWFCNGKMESSSSHIVTHLVLSRHHTVSLHEDSHLGDTTLECYSCGQQNVFTLGYINAKEDQVVVILCRLPCSQLKDSNWDSTSWKPLIEERQFLSWISSIPTEDDSINARMITYQQMYQLESGWRNDKDITFNDLNHSSDKKDDPSETTTLPTLMRYNDGYQYQASFGPLVKLESDYDKQLKEAQNLDNLQITWSQKSNGKIWASFPVKNFEAIESKVSLGDGMILRHFESEWLGKGSIIGLPDAHQELFTLELNESKSPPPIPRTTGFTAEFIWKGVSYERMQSALKTFAISEKSTSSYIYHKILGHDVKPIEFDIELPKQLSIPKLAKLNGSQSNAIRMVLKRPLSLIQGPPGTGKTVTSATIIYHLNRMNAGQKILVCAPSNIAVDHLAEKLDSIGLNVVRLFAKSREDAESSVRHLSLENKVMQRAQGRLKNLIRLQEQEGELKGKDFEDYSRMFKAESTSLLDRAEIICCTCVGAGSFKLAKYQFRMVLVDESTQAAEPEALIPIIKGSKQVILVGDHQQLGPVILNKEASDSGLSQSLFERLILLGHVPIRLEVQYRMNPFLSDFPSNMFYEGSLQDGVSTEQRTLPVSTFPWPVPNIPMMFWGNFGTEEISASGVSFLNRVEAMNVEKIITRLFKGGIQPEQIGVITPYEGQRAFITSYMTLNGSIFERKDDYASIEVTSVDAFQGREKDFIILSCVRANQDQKIGFLKDPRRLNVAITRAKYGLIILGNTQALSRNFLWNELLLYFREKGCLVDGPLENLKLSTIQLNTPSIPKTFARSTLNSISSNASSSIGYQESSNNSSVSFSSERWPQLSKSNTNTINSNFYSKLSKLNQEYQQNSFKINEDDIKSITSSFADGFNLN